MKWWSYLICVLIIFLGFSAGVWLNDRFGIKNQSIGTPVTIEQQQGLEEVVKYDFGYIQFSDEDKDGVFTYQQTFSPVDLTEILMIILYTSTHNLFKMW